MEILCTKSLLVRLAASDASAAHRTIRWPNFIVTHWFYVENMRKLFQDWSWHNLENEKKNKNAHSMCTINYREKKKTLIETGRNASHLVRGINQKQKYKSKIALICMQKYKTVETIALVYLRNFGKDFGSEKNHYRFARMWFEFHGPTSITIHSTNTSTKTNSSTTTTEKMALYWIIELALVALVYSCAWYQFNLTLQ